MKHKKQDYVEKCILANLSPKLVGARGTGKTTIVLNIAKKLNRDLYIMAGSKQTTVGNILGFISVTGDYIPTQFRKAIESGGIFLLDEIDAMDANVLLTFNMLENGKIPFPDKVVDIHKDFRFVSTANPVNEHSAYTGRSKLDASTDDRHHTVSIDHDKDLESSIVSKETKLMVDSVRSIINTEATGKEVTMRDAIRMDKLLSNGISEDPILDVVYQDDKLGYHSYKDKVKAIEVEIEKKQEKEKEEERKKNMTQKDATSVDELFELVELGK